MVRCNIQYSNLERAAGSSSSSSSSAPDTTSSTSSIIATSSISSTEFSTSAEELASSTAATSDVGNALQTPLPAGTTGSQGQGTSDPSPGLIAGATVVGTLGFVALLVLGYLILRRLLKTRQQTGSGSGYPSPPGASQPAYGYHDYSQTAAAVDPASYGYPAHSTQRMGAMANWKPVYDYQPKDPVELSAAWGGPKPTELL